MDNLETPSVQNSADAFDAPAAGTSFDAAFGPLGWCLTGSVVAGLAAVPVLSAAIGEVEHFGLIAVPAFLIGGLAGFTGLLVAGLASNGIKAWRSARANVAERRAQRPEPVRGQLALD